MGSTLAVNFDRYGGHNVGVPNSERCSPKGVRLWPSSPFRRLSCSCPQRDPECMDRRCVARGNLSAGDVGSCTNVSDLSAERFAMLLAIMDMSAHSRRPRREWVSGGHMAASVIFPCSVEDGLSPPRPFTFPRAPCRSLVKAGPAQGRPQGLGLDEARRGAKLRHAGAHRHG